MTIREMRMELGDTQSEFADRYRIPFRTGKPGSASLLNTSCACWNVR